MSDRFTDLNAEYVILDSFSHMDEVRDYKLEEDQFAIALHDGEDGLLITGSLNELQSVNYRISEAIATFASTPKTLCQTTAGTERCRRSAGHYGGHWIPEMDNE